MTDKAEIVFAAMAAPEEDRREAWCPHCWDKTTCVYDFIGYRIATTANGRIVREFPFRTCLQCGRRWRAQPRKFSSGIIRRPFSWIYERHSDDDGR